MPIQTIETKKEKHQPEPAREDLRIAQEAYTLARILSEHFAAAQPWTLPLGPAAVEPPAFGFWTH